MSLAFPRPFLDLVRCTKDGAPLEAPPELQSSFDDHGIRDGQVRCTRCSALFRIDAGILDLIGEVRPIGEGAIEQSRRDAISAKVDVDAAAWDTDENRMEMLPTLEAVDARSDTRLLELGCGDGRYTTVVAKRCRELLAVDFSRGSLEVLQRRLGVARNVGLVHGDVTTLRVTPEAFDRAFSTLTSNLPTPAARDALNRLAAGALNEHGVFVSSMHHHGWQQRLRRTPQDGHYRNGIFRRYFTGRESRKALAAHFAHVATQPVQIYLPLAYRLKLPMVAQSRFAERLPVFNGLGKLLISRARKVPPPKPALYRRKRSWFAVAMTMGMGYWALSED